MKKIEKLKMMKKISGGNYGPFYIVSKVENKSCPGQSHTRTIRLLNTPDGKLSATEVNSEAWFDEKECLKVGSLIDKGYSMTTAAQNNEVLKSFRNANPDAHVEIM